MSLDKVQSKAGFFHELFNTLRLKAVTLLALTLMLRRSDIVPNGVIFYDSPGLTLRQNFTLKNLVFERNHMKVTFFGMKNDAQRKGFEVILPKSNVVKIDLVQTLYDYTKRTWEDTGQDGPVFISFRSPYNAVDSSTVSKLLEEVIFYQRVLGKFFSSHRGDDCDCTKLESRDC